MQAIALTQTASMAAGNNNNGSTVGDCISDGFYGNEPNIVGPFAPGGPAEQEPGTKGGRVVPSQSPGPKVDQSRRGRFAAGASLGDVNKQFGPGLGPLSAGRSPASSRAVREFGGRLRRRPPTLLSSETVRLGSRAQRGSLSGR